MSDPRPIVVVGSGLAGYSVARELRKLDAAVPIVMLTEDGGEAYAKPTLSNAFALKRAPGAIATGTAAQMAVQLKMDIRTRTMVESIDPAAGRIVTRDGAIDYRALVLAVGARQLPLPGLSDGARVLNVNSLDDYGRFHAALEGRRHALILGAGFIGCEFANDLIGVGLEVDVVDLAPNPLNRFWPAPMARAFVAKLAAAGVCWHLGRRVTAIRSIGDAHAVTLDDGSTLEADIVLSALGLVPRLELARNAGLAVGRGIHVDARLATSVAGIYALGDCAEVEGQVLPFIMPIMHCARALAKTLTGTPTAVRYPPMPVVLKTPACPAVFLPPPAGATGTWSCEGSADEMIAEFADASGDTQGVALLGAATKRREEWTRRLAAVQV